MTVIDPYRTDGRADMAGVIAPLVHQHAAAMQVETACTAGRTGRRRGAVAGKRPATARTPIVHGRAGRASGLPRGGE